MKNLLLVFSILFIIACAFASCSDANPQISVNAEGFVVVNGVVTDIVADGEDVITVGTDGYVIVNGIKTKYQLETEEKDTIHYSVTIGTKIETLSLIKQKLLDEYIEDCKTIMLAQYAYNYSSTEYQCYSEPYFAITDAFIYDFRDINEASMSEDSLNMWNFIKEEIGEGKTPLMYIELDGYACKFFNNYIVTSFDDIGMTNGFFIFDDDSVVLLNYKYVSQRFYNYMLIDDTKIINCGDKYAEELSKNDILTFDFEQELIRLKIEE